MKYLLDALAAAGGVLIAAAVTVTLRAALLARDTARQVQSWMAEMPRWRTDHQNEHRDLDKRVEDLELWRAASTARARGRTRHTLAG